MSIVSMKKLNLLGLKREQALILSSLQKMGVVEIIDMWEDDADSEKSEKKSQLQSEVAEELSNLEEKLSNLKFGIEFLKPYDKSPNPIIYGKPNIKKDELLNILSREEEILNELDGIFRLDRKITQLKVEKSKIESNIEMLTPWRQLDIPLEQLGETDKAVFMPAVMSKKAREKFDERISEEELLAELKVLGEKQDEVYTLIIYHKDCTKNMQDIFKELSVTVQDFPDFQGTPDEVIKLGQKRLKDIEKEREEIRQKSKKLSKNLLYFQVLYDYYSVERDKKSAFLKVKDSDKTFFVQAWIPEPFTEKVEKQILKTTENVYIEFIEPDKDDKDIPVLLNNGKLVEPFEVITELYSLPDPNGIDPNLFMAPFFFVFFGMMLSDAGYGLIISLLAGYALWKFKLLGMGKKFTAMLFLCGISTVIWGAIFGSWFGDLIKVKPIWMNPLDNPVSVLVLAFAFGIIQIYTGIILNAYKNIRAGRIIDALMDQGLWLILLTGLLMFLSPDLQGVGKYMALVSALGLILTQGRSQKSLVKRLMSGVLSLYDITGYLSDVLSYSRLLALGLTTGVIATVVNTIAKTVGGSFIGYILMALIIVGGHIFNLAINVLGAYVHSSRLQYIEFFSKFYDSGGRAFNPLHIKTTYVDLEDIQNQF